VVEADFRQIKDPNVVSFSPMFHFTEQKIRVESTSSTACSLSWSPSSWFGKPTERACT
jgi:hypothetical protein